MRFLKQVLLSFIFFVFVLFSFPVYAWNWVGHELVAQIAYDQLTPEERTFWNQRIQVIRAKYPKYFKKYSKEKFIRASTFLDDLRKQGIHKYNSWHFIDLPIYLNNDPGAYFPNPLNAQNIIWAINDAIKVEKKSAMKSQKDVLETGFFAAILIHLIADAHQPLHCAELYSKHFPHGDYGGNLYKLKNRKFRNLHAYWDQGGGYLVWSLTKNKKLLEASAKMLEKKYPKVWFGSRVRQVDPNVWVQESHELAKNAYTDYGIKEYSNPSKAYQKEVEKITQEQIVLAGYRLAEVLKKIDGRIVIRPSM